NLLGLVLVDDVLVEDGADLGGSGQLLALLLARLVVDFLANDVVAQVHAFVADEHGRTGDQLAHLMLALAAEGTVQQFSGVVFGLVTSHDGTPLLRYSD